MNPMRNRWVLGLGVFALTAGSYAQWTNPADDVPAYHASAPLKGEQRGIPTAVQLPLRPVAGAHEPAELF